MLVKNVVVTLLPDPDDYNTPEDKKWQETCEGLYLDMKENIPQEQADIRPTGKKGLGDTRGTDIFFIWSVSLASIGGFKTLYELLRLWVENKNQNKERVSAKIRIGNNEVNISNISREEAIALCKRHLAEGQTQLTP